MCETMQKGSKGATPYHQYAAANHNCRTNHSMFSHFTANRHIKNLDICYMRYTESFWLCCLFCLFVVVVVCYTMFFALLCCALLFLFFHISYNLSPDLFYSSITAHIIPNNILAPEKFQCMRKFDLKIRNYFCNVLDPYHLYIRIHTPCISWHFGKIVTFFRQLFFLVCAG